MSLEVITGPMFSGKTEELLRRLRRHQIAKRFTLLLKPSIDNRWGVEDVQSHSGFTMPCQIVNNLADLTTKLAFNPRTDVLGVDEVQFMDEAMTERLYFESKYRTVICSGLDLTYALKPWKNVQLLMSHADRVDKFPAVCVKCGEDAGLTQRLIDGKPASFNGPDVLVGGLEKYEARCRSCFQIG